MKGRLLKRLFKMKAREIYAKWLEQNETPVEEQLKFGYKWVKLWEREYGVSLRKPNKHYTPPYDDLCIRLKDYLKNVWTVRNFFLKTYGVDPPVLNGDQMLLHRNESTTFKNMDTYVKENYSLSRGRATVFTQVSSDPTANFIPEFVFKGKRTRIKLNPPEGMKVQWSDSGSYRLECMLKTIENFPNRNRNPFSNVLDNYAVHIMPEFRKALWSRGYVLVLMGGSITGFIQQNDTHIHRSLKNNYRNSECALMIEILQPNKNKVPSPTRDKMMSMLANAWSFLTADSTAAFKFLFITNALDSSKDHLVSEKLFRLIGTNMLFFWAELLTQQYPKSLDRVVRKLIPPKGMKRKEFTRTEVFTDSTDHEEEDVVSEGEESEMSDTDATLHENVNETDTVNQTPFCTVVLQGAVSLQNIVDDPDINKDAKLLDDLSIIIDDADVSTVFMPHIQNFDEALADACKSIRKRTENTQ